MHSITLKQAEQFVEKTHFTGWDGWDLVIFDSRQDGYNRTNGVFRNGKWMTKSTYRVNKEGKYELPAKYARFFISS